MEIKLHSREKTNDWVVSFDHCLKDALKLRFWVFGCTAADNADVRIYDAWRFGMTTEIGLVHARSGWTGRCYSVFPGRSNTDCAL